MAVPVGDEDDNHVEQSTKEKSLNSNLIFVALTLSFFSVSIDETVLYPLLPKQVESFGVAKDEKSIGYFAGLIGSAYFLGAAIGSTPWGMLSDRIGRKPIMILGICSNILWSSLYGFSTNLWLAVLTRFCNGLFGGLYPAAKVVLAEIPTKSSTGGNYLTFGLGWSWGFLIGPTIGGLLSEAAVNYPDTFSSDSWVAKYPFALPCLVVAAIALVNLVVVVFFLPETLGLARKSTELEKKPLHMNSHVQEIHIQDIETTLASPNQDSEINQGKGGLMDFFGQWEIVLLSVMYGTYGLVAISTIEVFPLWAETSWLFGGLDFTPSTVGLVQAGAGLLLTPFQLFLFLPIVDYLGPLATLKASALANAGLIFIPICRFLPSYNSRGILASIFIFIRLAGCCTMGTAYLVLLANCVDDPRHLGMVNGISQTFLLSFEAFGPAAGSSIYAWSISEDHSFPFDYTFFWNIIGLLCLLQFVVAYIFPKSIDQRKYIFDEEPEKSTELEAFLK